MESPYLYSWLVRNMGGWGLVIVTKVEEVLWKVSFSPMEPVLILGNVRI